MANPLILNLQNVVLTVSPGLLPTAALAFSALNSWHCTLMCGAYAVGIGERPMHRLLGTRLLGYTAMGALMGFGGNLLVKALEFKVLNVIAFVIFMGLTIFCILPNLLPGLSHFSFSFQLPRDFRQKVGPTFSGLLFAVTPCHLLTFYYGLAATTGSAFLGGALLFGHVVITSPALAYAPKYARKISQSSPWLRGAVRILILAMVVLHALYFTGRLLNPGEDVHQKILFCF